MILAERVAAAATQMIATGMNTASAVMTMRRGSAFKPLSDVSPSPPSSRKNTTQPNSQTTDRARATSSPGPSVRCAPFWS